MKIKRKPFKLNCFGVLGILLLISGIFSGFVVYYTMIGLFK
tara:strand:- start:638 stop:760 length:123 start_codon:yes stop_codon:yes gene_type:complete